MRLVAAVMLLVLVSHAMAEDGPFLNQELPPGLRSTADGNSMELIPLDDLEPGQQARVMIYLKDSGLSAPASSGELSEDRISDIRAKQAEVIARHGDSLEVKNRFALINGFSAIATKETIKELESDPEVERVEPVGWFKTLTSDTKYVINATEVWNMQFYDDNVTGDGQTICILDTGIRPTHDYLGDCSIASIHAGTCSKMPYCYNFHDSDNDCSDEDTHGTRVAGIVASTFRSFSGFNWTGMAPSSKIVPMKVTDTFNFQNFDYGRYDAVSKAIESCRLNKSAWDVSVILMAIGSDCGNNCPGASCECSCDEDTCNSFDWDSGTNASIHDAYDAGIFIVGATGNEGDTTQISYPSCHQRVFAVGATDDTDSVWATSNSCDLLDVWAPGDAVWSTSTASDTAYDNSPSGTSFAAAHVAAAGALIQQYSNLLNNSDLEPEQILLALNNTGKSITRGSLVRNRINIMDALRYYNYQGPRLSNGAADTYFGSSSYLFNFTVTYEDADGSAPSFVDVIIEGTPYGMKATGVDFYRGVTYYYNGTLASGLHEFYFNASDGKYANNVTGVHPSNVRVNDNFTFTSPSVSPTDGDTSSSHTFSVVYTDPDDMAPLYMNVVVDGSLHAMAAGGSDWDSGVTYSYDGSSYSYGTHDYYFNGSDNYYNHSTQVYSDLLIHSPPVLSDGAVSPGFGWANDDLFNFTVLYTDSDDDAPSYVRVTVDGQSINLKATGSSYDSGVTYYRNLTLSDGMHTYSFSANDGYYDDTFAEQDGPEVWTTTPNCTGAATNEATWDIDEATTCTNTFFIPTDPMTGLVQVTGGSILTLENTGVHINNTRIILTGFIILDDADIEFMR